MRSSPTRLVKSMSCGNAASSVTLSRSASLRPSPSMTVVADGARAQPRDVVQEALRSRAMRAVSVWRTVILMRWLREAGPHLQHGVARAVGDQQDLAVVEHGCGEHLGVADGEGAARRAAAAPVSPANIWISWTTASAARPVPAARRLRAEQHAPGRAGQDQDRDCAHGEGRPPAPGEDQVSPMGRLGAWGGAGKGGTGWGQARGSRCRRR